jgi:hypothetical protein
MTRIYLARSHQDPELGILADQLSAARTQLANLVIRGVGDGDPMACEKKMGRALAEREEADAALARASASYRDVRQKMTMGFEAIRELVRGMRL